MAEVKQLTFNYKEIAETLVKTADIHEGHWGVYMKFAIHGANITTPESPLVPAAVVPVVEIGIQRFDQANELTVNATQVNPLQTRVRTKAGARKHKR